MEKPWFKFYDLHVPKNLEYQAISLTHILDEAAAQFPAKTAIFFFGGKVTFEELRAQANQFAHGLQNLGLEKGGRVGLLLPNMPQFVIAALGTLKAGGAVVFFDPLGDEEDLKRQIRETGVEVLVVFDLILPRVDPIFAQTGVKNFIITRVQDFLPFPRNWLFSLAARGRGLHVKVARKPQVHLFKEFLLNRIADQPPQVPVEPEEVAFIQYTRGTSGSPKPVLLTHRNLVASLVQATSWMGAGEKGKEIFLSLIPFHQFHGMTLALNLPLYLAALSIQLPRFETLQILSLVKKHGTTFFPVTPPMVELLASYPDLPKYKINTVKIFWAMGDPLPQEELQNFERRVGRKVNESYGLTEAPLTHANPVLGKRKLGSIGIPLPDTDARIVDLERGEREMPPGEVGELVVRGPQVMKGYLGRPEETSQALREGWLYTGDLSRMDEEGYFYLAGKKK